jgi:hypothetical protein
MPHQLKVSRGSVNRCSCGCGLRKNPRRIYAPGCNGSRRNPRVRAKPNCDSTKTFTNQKRGDLVQYTGTQAVRINQEARQMEKSTSLGAAFKRARRE